MDYKKLDAWKLTMELATEIYTIVKQYPKEELFALTAQTKRAVLSIPSNIAEGIGRNYKKDTIQFLHIARGSSYEVETLLQLAVAVNCIPKDKVETTLTKLEKCKQLINGLINYFEKSNLK